MNNLHPGAKWLFRLRAYSSLIFLGIFLGIFIFPFIGIFLALGAAGTGTFLTSALLGVIIIIIFVVVFGEIYTHMAYNRWLYEVGEDNLRLERGIIWKKYSNIPYERVQNIDIHRGIIARMFGFSSLLIQTAGYSAPVRGGHAEGSIPAVDSENAEKIREYILHRIKGKKQGL